MTYFVMDLSCKHLKASCIWDIGNDEVEPLLQVFDSSFQSKRVGVGAGMASGGGSVPAFALGLSTTGLLEPTRVSEEHQVDAGKAPKGEVRGHNDAWAYGSRTGCVTFTKAHATSDLLFYRPWYLQYVIMVECLARWGMLYVCDVQGSKNV